MTHFESFLHHHRGVVLHDLRHDPGFGQGRNVPQLVRLVGRDLAQDATHDLAGASFRQA